MEEGRAQYGIGFDHGDYLVVEYLADVASEVHVTNLKTKESFKLDLPEISSVFQVEVASELNGILYSVVTFTQPLTYYFYDFEGEKSVELKASNLPVDTSAFVTERHLFRFPDGAKIPVFVTHKKDIDLTAVRVCCMLMVVLSISMTPSFNPSNLYLLEQGGVGAQALCVVELSMGISGIGMGCC